jgi:hypothetical protein
MKTINFFLSGIIALVLFACDEPNQPAQTAQKEVYVNIEAESDYNNDSVKVMLDDEVLVESKITTNYTIGLAWSSGLRKISRNNCRIRCNLVEHGIVNNYEISTKFDTSTITIIFNRNSGQISFSQFRGLMYRN